MTGKHVDWPHVPGDDHLQPNSSPPSVQLPGDPLMSDFVASGNPGLTRWTQAAHCAPPPSCSAPLQDPIRQDLHNINLFRQLSNGTGILFPSRGAARETPGLRALLLDAPFFFTG